MGPEIERLARQLEDLVVERDTLPRHLEALRKLLPLVPELTRFDTYDTMAVVIDARHAGALGDLNERMTELLGGNFEIISDRVDTGTIGAVVVFPARARSEVEAIFGHQQVSRLRLPLEYEAVPFRQAITEMEQKATIAGPRNRRSRELRLEDLVRPHLDWPAAVVLLKSRQDQLHAIRKLGATPHTFVSVRMDSDS